MVWTLNNAKEMMRRWVRLWLGRRTHHREGGKNKDVIQTGIVSVSAAPHPWLAPTEPPSRDPAGSEEHTR